MDTVLDTPRNIVVLKSIVLASEELYRDKRIRSYSGKIDRLIVLSLQYGEKDKITKKEIRRLLSTELEYIVTGYDF